MATNNQSKPAATTVNQAAIAAAAASAAATIAADAKVEADAILALAAEAEAIAAATKDATVTVPETGVPASEVTRPVVQTAAVVTPAKVTEDIATAKVEKVTATAEGIFTQYTDTIAKLSVSTQMRFTRLAAYVDAMKPGKPLTDSAGAAYQRMLLDVLVGIINSEEDFNTAFGVLVQIFKQNRAGCFADTHAGRFVHALPGSSEERHAFQRLMNLMAVLGSLNDVTLIRKQVNLQHATAFMVTPAGRERLIAWFG